MSIYIAIPVLMLLAGILIFVFIRNRNDLKSYKKQIQEDYKKHKEEEHDSDTEEHTH